VAVVEGPAGPRGASARWLELTGRRRERLPARACTSDLVVFGRVGESAMEEYRPVIEATLFGAGRPILIAPATATRGIGGKVAIAWNGRAEAARAVAGAMPLLKAAAQVQVLTAATRRTDCALGQGLVAHLASHGITATCRVVDAEEETVGAALLRVAEAGGADLLVMGGYGRSRFSELILGGVTRHALDHAELAVLLAH
jgi:nucleotide-binding universal stress UspA family protein